VRNKLFKISLFLLLLIGNAFSLKAITAADTVGEHCYKEAYSRLEKMLKLGVYDLESAVYYVENAYYNDSLSFEAFHDNIRFLTSLVKAYNKNNRLLYALQDSNIVGKHACLFKVLTDSIPIALGDTVTYHLPFTYNFEDFDGTKDWSNMFVSTLLFTHKGNCHSLPFLYKILGQQLGVESYLSLAPNHIYIKLFNQKDGWYNVELTSGEFPIDGWLMASGYIHLTAVQNAIYMDTVSDRKCIAMCLLDLAQGYQRKFGLQDGSFILQCCNAALNYFPNYINALLLQSETYQAQFTQKLKKSNFQNPQDLINSDTAAKSLFNKLEGTVKEIHRLGYRRMPERMYMEWLASLKTQKDKFTNKNIANFTNDK
jgi:hypothetical protein